MDGRLAVTGDPLRYAGASPRNARGRILFGDFLVCRSRHHDPSSISRPCIPFQPVGPTSRLPAATHRNPEYDVSDDTLDDDDLLPDSLESSYTCASAAAGALNWQPVEETDVAARRAFWLWYLDEAIPAVLAS